MKRTSCILALLLASSSSAAIAQSSVFVCIGPPSIGACAPVSATNPFPVSGTFTPSATSPNFTPVAPAAATATKGTLLGIQYDSTQKTLTDGQQAAASASARGALFVATGADAFTVAGGGTAGSAAAGVMTVQGVASMTPVQVTLPTTPLIASGSGVVTTPTSVSTGATTRASSTAAASSLVLKSGAGNLYDLKITIGATTGYVLLFDATSLPSNGAVTPIFCEAVTSNGTYGGAAFAWPTPMPFATGITAGFSTTGCFTLTASATAAFFGGYK